MRRTTLQRQLARQWMLFTLGMALLFGAAGMLLLFVLEDSFIDRRLREVAALAAQHPRDPLPRGFEAWTASAVPADLAPRLARLPVGAIAELRRADGRYLHILRAAPDGAGPVYVVSDATAQLAVNPGLARLAPWLAGVMLVLLGLAWWMARAFVRDTTRRATRLLEDVRAGDDPARLRRRAAEEPVHELAELASRLAEAWSARLAAIERERETIAFLAHELRTPLQSARTSVALLEDEPMRPELRQRLQRAVQRLERASHSVLWLAGGDDPSRHSTPPAPVLRTLVDTFAPLARERRQALVVTAAVETRWAAPVEVVEAILANLLLNAVQHGGEGRIEVGVTEAGFEIVNPPAGSPSTEGFGLGLEIVRRLCARCGWSLVAETTDARVVHRVVTGAAAAHPAARGE